MRAFKNTAEVHTYATEAIDNDGPTLVVRSHWNLKEIAELEVSGKKVFVNIEELKAALDNAANAHRF